LSSDQRLTDRDINRFDIEDHDYVQDIFQVYAEMNRHGPVTWAETYGGHWVVTGYDAVRRSARDWRTFTSTQGVMHPAAGVADTPPITTDPPLQQLYRKLILPYFTPTEVSRIEPATRAHAAALIDAFAADGRADLSLQFAERLIPLVFFSEVVHLPDELVPRFVEKTVGTGATPHEHSIALAGLAGEFVAARRAGPPMGDVMDALLTGTLDGVPLTDEQVERVATILLIGGTDTTRNVITTGLWYLAEHPDLRRRLAERPELMPKAVEELLRLYGSVQLVGRTVTTETTIGAHRMCPGDKVVMSIAAADRDPAEFPDAGRFDLDRVANRHIAFGVGVHRCLGSNLARMEIRVALEEILRRVPDYRLADGYRYVRRSGHVHGPETLPVTFTPASTPPKGSKS
jgi:cytochrome P450